ncbi:Os04g0275550 [Oryza sativa Japonica Group]|uniref:Os04g0275550 protein n=1 Tax=Oryza sativa subsp. japonica TaxID=39947 RepID=A0A0P0W8A7_ORYSJ|nr:Os04g0275550 [Oryza sativa Japonica Group]
MAPGYSSGGSSKRTRSDSTRDALNRLADLRVQSNESWARREEQKQAKSARACMEMLKADGITRQDPIYHTALRMFRDGYLRDFFIKDCITPEERLNFIHQHGGLPYPPAFAPDPLLFAPLPPPTCSGHMDDWYKRFGPQDDDGGDGANGGSDGNMSTSSERSYGSDDGYYSDEEDSILDMLVAALKARLSVRAARREPQQEPQQSGMEWMMETMANPSNAKQFSV